MDVLNPATVFVKNENGFGIITQFDASFCSVEGFFALTCYTHTACNEFQLWENYASENGQACGILYSPKAQPVKFSQASWGSKIQIFASGAWNLVFSIESFSGVDPYDYFQTGKLENPNSGTIVQDKLFRDDDIQNKILSALYIKVLVYNFEKTEVVSEVGFNGNSNFETWFAFENVYYSSLWNLEQKIEWGSIFTIAETQKKRYFYINQKFSTCDGDKGWIMIGRGYDIFYSF